MSDIVRSGRADSHVAQFDLFELASRAETNSVFLWDVAPRYVFRFGDEGIDENQKLVERSFRYGNAAYSLTVVPARFIKGGVVVEMYPSEREQLVEEVVRQIATRSSRLSFESGGEQVRVAFSIYEIGRELQRTGHVRSHAEIVEALQILHGSQVQITRVDDGGRVKLVSGSTFPHLAFSDRGSEVSQTLVSFNWLVSESIKRLEFRSISYDAIMNMPNPIARWLYKRFSHDAYFLENEAPTRTILASEVFEGCGIAMRARLRDSVRKVTIALEWLVGHGTVQCFTAEGLLEGQKKVDTEFQVTLSDTFMQTCRRANMKAGQRLAAFKEETGATPDKFVKAKPRTRRTIAK